MHSVGENMTKSFFVKKRAAYKRYTRSKFVTFIIALFLILAGLFTILPLIYSISTSFKPLEELLKFPPAFFVSRPTVQNYLQLPSIIASLSVPLSRYVFNSLFISIVTTAGHVIIAAMAAFAMSKGRYRGLAVVFLIVQFSLLYNNYTLAVPQYIIMSKLRLVDTFWVYILPYLPSSLGVFLIKQYMDGSIPDALLEAAYIDGAGEFKMFWRIVMPNSKPAWMTLIMFAFRDLWSLQPQGTIFTEELKLLPNVMSTIISGGIARSGSAMAAMVLLMIPPLLVYLVSQSSIVETMTTSGIK